MCSDIRITRKDGSLDESAILEGVPPIIINNFIYLENGVLKGPSEYCHADGIFAAMPPPTVSDLHLTGPKYVGGFVKPDYQYKSPMDNYEGEHVFKLIVADDESGTNEMEVASKFPYSWTNEDEGKHWKVLMVPYDKDETAGEKVETSWSKQVIQPKPKSD